MIQKLKQARESSMSLNEYQEFTAKTQIHFSLEHLVPAMVEELGELMGHVKRSVRDNKPYDINAVEKELGDILWCWSEICRHFALLPQDVLLANVKKLTDRQSRGKISGSGDNR